MDIEISGVNLQTPSLEVIDFQDASFGLILEKHIESIVKDINIGRIKTVNDLKNRTEIKDLEKSIKDRLGLTVKIVISSTNPAATVTPKIGSYNIADYKQFRGHKDNFNEVDKVLSIYKKSVINSKKAKISGAISGLNNFFYFNPIILVKDCRLNIKEIVSIILHELGHVFTYYEYMTKLTEINVILEDSFKLRSNKGLKNPEVILYKKFKYINVEVEKEIVNDLINGKKIIPILAMAKIYTSVTVSVFQNRYNDKTSERLADLFSSRFGYGLYLVKALEKLNEASAVKDYYNKERVNEKFEIISSTLRFLSIAYLTAIKLNVVINSIYLSYIFITSLKLLLSQDDGEGNFKHNYDVVIDRYKKIRNDLVRSLKNNDFDIEYKKDVLDDIKTIDEIMFKTDIKDTELIEYIRQYLVPKYKLNDNKFKRQELLEELEANDLFVQSAELEIIRG